MSRSLGSQLQGDLAAAGATKSELIELQFGDPTSQADFVRITTASQDLLVRPDTSYAAAVVWAGIGGVIDYGALAESTDPSGQQVTLKISGVDQSVISKLMGQQYLGRRLRIWYLHLDPDGTHGGTAGQVLTDPLEMFRGWMNGGWNIEENRPAEGSGTVTVTCRVGTWMSGLRSQQGIFCNVHSHQLKAPGDTFFQNVPSLVNRKFYWGQPTPQSTSPSGPVNTSGWGPTGPIIGRP